MIEGMQTGLNMGDLDVFLKVAWVSLVVHLKDNIYKLRGARITKFWVCIHLEKCSCASDLDLFFKVEFSQMLCTNVTCPIGGSFWTPAVYF